MPEKGSKREERLQTTGWSLSSILGGFRGVFPPSHAPVSPPRRT